jgi:opacity protein-like surface antigen
MKKLVSTVALLAITANFSIAGGNIKPVLEPIEVAKPELVIAKPELVVNKPELVVNKDIQYNGFYLGAAVSHMSMNEAVTSGGYALSFVAGYYFNKYFGLESRYSRTVLDVDVDHGAEIVSQSDVLENIGIYFKPVFNLTTGFSFYGLAGYGQSSYEKENHTYREDGLQLGLGAKYELSEGVGIFIDYLDMYNDDNFDGILIKDVSYGSINIGTTYTF